jgi:hypothetical protein
MVSLMKRRMGAASGVVLAALAIALGSPRAQAAIFAPVTTVVGPDTILVDEFGHGLFTPPASGTVGLPFDGADPGPGALPGVLSYGLPVPVITGDVALTEPPNTAFSDVIRFSGASLYFYSDISPSDPPETFFDIGLPTANYPNLVIHDEIGPEDGLNGVDYTPGPGDPGFDVTGLVVTYHLVSDVAPEPASLGLLVLGGTVMLLRRRR